MWPTAVIITNLFSCKTCFRSCSARAVGSCLWWELLQLCDLVCDKSETHKEKQDVENVIRKRMWIMWSAVLQRSCLSMQAIVGLSRGISRALVQGVVQRSQGSTEASQRAGTEDADSRLGQYSHYTYQQIILQTTLVPVKSNNLHINYAYLYFPRHFFIKLPNIAPDRGINNQNLSINFEYLP